MKKKRCIICNTSFEPYIKKQKFCHRKCAIIFYTIKKGILKKAGYEWRKETTCICGKVFIKKTKRHHKCSEHCYNRSSEQKARVKKYRRSKEEITLYMRKRRENFSEKEKEKERKISQKYRMRQKISREVLKEMKMLYDIVPKSNNKNEQHLALHALKSLGLFQKEAKHGT